MPITTDVFRISIKSKCTTLCYKVCQWLATGRWFYPGPLVSSTNKTDLHDITEILLKVVLNTIKQTIYLSIINYTYLIYYCTTYIFFNVICCNNHYGSLLFPNMKLRFSPIRHMSSYSTLVILFMAFGCIAIEYFFLIIWLLSLSSLNVPDKDYFRNALCALNLISTFLLWYVWSFGQLMFDFYVQWAD